MVAIIQTEQTSPLLQLGIGGIFVLLLLNLLLPWLLKVVRKSNGTTKSGELDPSYWQKTIREIQEDVMQRAMISLLKPSLDAQTDVLREIRESSKSMRDDVKELLHAQQGKERRGGLREEGREG